MFLLIVLPTLFWFAGWLLLVRLGEGAPRDNDGDDLSVSIVIPARNEEKNLGFLLSSLVPQLASKDECIVVDDHSTDKTFEVAERFGVTCVSSRELPAGWTGKTHALCQGASVATNQTIVFLDADLFFESGGLKILKDTARKEVVFSVMPFHTVKRSYEQLSLYFQSVMACGVGAFEHRLISKSQGLFGQMLVIRKDVYQRVGTHAAVKQYVLENFYLARKLAELGVVYQSFNGQGIVSMRMYPDGFAQLYQGWVKAFAKGASETSPRRLLLTSLWISGAMGASIMVMLLPFILTKGSQYAGLTLVVYIAYALQLGWFARRLGSYAPWSWIFFPVPLFFYQIVFFHSLFRKTFGKSSAWKGRNVSG